MPEKRHLDDGSGLENDNKRPRSNNASPAPNGAPKMDLTAKIAEARARAAQVAARHGSKQRPPPSGPPVQSPIEIARAKAAAFSQRTSSAASNAHETPKPTPGELARAKAEALRKRKALELANQPSENLTKRRQDETIAQYRERIGGGLGIGLHPALQDSPETKAEPLKEVERSKTSRRREPSPRRPMSEDVEAKDNPYLSKDVDAETEGARSRPARALIFNPHGKFIEEAAKERRRKQLEEMRGLLQGVEKAQEQLGPERAFVIEEPPEIEWWDESFVNGTDYTNLDAPGKLKLDGDDSLITIYVLHPVPIQPPQEKNAPPPKPLYLTKKEMAKNRRTRRKADLKDEQAKIRLGLVEPPPPKVKKSNLMRVLGNQAVQDPTAVEARVNREIEERLAKHEAANADRALTKEERGEKLVKRQLGDAAKGIHVALYRIGNLSYGKHRYQIDQNAKQQALTGIGIMTPNMNIVIVEGGQRALQLYRKLMQRRIKWHENFSRPKKNSGEDEEEDEAEEGPPESKHAFMSQYDENGDLKDNSENKCILVWEGEVKERSFRQWRGMRACETEQEAKDQLSKFKMENMWNLAKAADMTEVQTIWTHDPTQAKKQEEDQLDAGLDDYE
ncbi:PRP3-domain-containing protein [Pseudovirgaria hyperparasitica]|uniref:PRP3-domain-containing protein n=1 Tax=Pseudovirgaria hyperparasitica TaxID=470096 RepID=A0A6A6VVR3_9PEZI|nr:PRP3-domain-containing protein [Pseudovirgaria hyperparasitica]KAF2753804.1 PRP3-domain-containing protein [Pseudovirgaria hyperparasitica]